MPWEWLRLRIQESLWIMKVLKTPLMDLTCGGPAIDLFCALLYLKTNLIIKFRIPKEQVE